MQKSPSAGTEEVEMGTGMESEESMSASTAMKPLQKGLPANSYFNGYHRYSFWRCQ